MLILLFFSFLAGIVTVLSPCVLPVLPALLSAGAGKGNLRPIGIILGLITSFTFFTLSLTAIVHLTGLSPDALRYIAIVLIAGFGLLMIFPSLGEKFAEATSGVADFGQSVQSKSKLFGTGFWSGFVLGIALGLVWTPCAGPILAAITTLVATSSLTLETLSITLAYSIGAAIPMFLIIYGGNKMISSSRSLSNYAEGIRKGFGVLMILAALAIAFHYDVMFEQFAIRYIPLINIEDTKVVKDELQKLRNVNATNPSFGISLSNAQKQEGSSLPKIAASPDFIGIVDWINSPPLTIQQLRGKVVLIDFWTYSCINCIRTLPYLKDWDAKYKDKGLVIVGVHTPEFEFEKNLANVKDAVKRFGIQYPVGLDNNYKTWQNFDNQYWPAHYLVDQTGIIRQFHFGEGAYLETENAIRSLLEMVPLVEGDVKAVVQRPMTPETYLGTERANRYQSEIKPQPDKSTTYTYSEPLGSDQVGLKGDWLIGEQKITSTGDNGSLDLNFVGTKVYLVMDAEKPELVTVLLDGKPLPDKYMTADMKETGKIQVKEPRKYDVIDLKDDYGRHTVTLKAPKGVSMYAFTFGDQL